jgi:hypothetical protein
VTLQLAVQYWGKSEISGSAASFVLACVRESKYPTISKMAAEPAALSRALLDRSRRAIPIERAAALGDARRTVSKSGAHCSCREGPRTLRDKSNSKNSRSTQVLGKKRRHLRGG